MKFPIRHLPAIALLYCCLTPSATAEPWAAPGDMRLRHDLQLLNDAGVTNLPLTSWPLSWGDIAGATLNTTFDPATPEVTAALQRVKIRAREESRIRAPLARITASVSSNPRFIRSFEDTPREEAELIAGITWTGEIFAFKLQGAVVDNSIDGDYFRPDGTYVGMALGNWMLSAGWQDHWWGPGRDGSLILSTNARPTPGISVQRNSSRAFESKWLRWIGPWSLTSFMNLMDDEREINDALLFGLRVSFKPIESLEIGLSRTAQWCGDGRPCDFKTFADLLLGNDNQGINVDPEDEPGNQLAGFDVRWALPKKIPIALYLQWIGEDGSARPGIPGSWLRQAGIEFWGNILGLQSRTHFEWSDSACHEGGVGSADIKPNCAYNHSIYKTGYRYEKKALGQGMDGDGLSYSLGSTLVQSAGHSWNILLRYMEINRAGPPDSGHTISATPQESVDIQVTHNRHTPIGRFDVGLGYNRLDDSASGATSNEVTGFIQWSTQ